jgi:hypothetical protein
VTRYFFHVQDGRSIPDLEGTELDGLDSARVEAVRLSGEMLRDGAREFWEGATWYMEVHDEADHHLFTLTFSARHGLSNARRA